MRFKEWLFHEENHLKDYKNPDHWLWHDGQTTFIYTSNHKIYYATERDSTHGKLIASTDELLDRYNLKNNNWFAKTFNKPMSEYGSDDLDDVYDDDPVVAQNSAEEDFAAYQGWRDRATQKDLFGRVSSDKNTVSFWNNSPDLYVKLLQPCLQQLVKDDKLNQQGHISTPLHGTIPMASVTNDRQADLTQSQADELEMYQQLHLMRGPAKKNAMERLGLSSGSNPHPISAKMRDSGMLKPGQKWWAINSEWNQN